MFKFLKKADYDNVVAGKKTAIAKFDMGYWRDVIIGSKITFTDGKNEVLATVTKKNFFSSVGEAWFSYKTHNGSHPVFPELDDIPVVNISDVNRYYSYDFPEVLMNNSGIVVVEFSLV